MKIRSITYFDCLSDPLPDQFLSKSEKFSQQAMEIFSSAGFEVQTIRFASQPFPLFLDPTSPDQVISYAHELENILQDQGFQYLSLGPALPGNPSSYSLIPDLIAATEICFLSGNLIEPGKGVSLPAVRACGKIINLLSFQDPDGFANLYFAALANVPAGSPYLPSAYSQPESQPGFAVALEAADLVLKSFNESNTFKDAHQALISRIETVGENLSRAGNQLAESCQVEFRGIDCSLAPYPDADNSLGAALENTGVNALGNHGSLAAAAFLAHSIDQANFQRAGFSGLMLPLLEDTCLAQRAAAGTLRLKDLLLYAAVCGTGLDTIPLPGASSPAQLSAVLFDLAALSTRLCKPLTARLMPIPGKEAGDPTSFDFPFFANSKVLDLQAEPLDKYFEGDGFLDLRPR